MNRFEQLHAMRYAENATKIYQFEKYKRLYPDLFAKHAVIKTRLADDHRDYYVPPALQARCLVIDTLAWDPAGCQYVSCFPYKTFDEPCRPNVDVLQWSRVDNEHYVPACQPACERGLSLETRYRDGDCFVVNQAKKLYAMYPERYNGMIAKHARLNFDEADDRLVIGPIYCRAYGLQFDEQAKECYVPAVQYATELFVGTSIFRRHLLQPLQNDFKSPPPPPTVPSLPALRADIRKAWTSNAPHIFPPSYPQQQYHPGTALNADLDEHGRLRPESVTKIVSEVAVDIGADLGLQALTSYAKVRLTQKISARLARRILIEKGLQRALVHGLAKAVTSGIVGKTAAMIGLRAGLSTASGVFAAYGIVSLVVDVFDPYEYGKVLDREQVERVDRTLDLRYFETDDFRNVRLTPEDVWNVLQDEDDVEDELSYYAERYEEYVDSLKKVPDHSRFTQKKIDLISNTTTTTTTTFMNSLIQSRSWVLGLFIIGSLMLMKYIEYVAVLLCVLLAVTAPR